jgi:hypothetical protein
VALADSESESATIYYMSYYMTKQYDQTGHQPPSHTTFNIGQ